MVKIVIENDIYFHKNTQESLKKLLGEIGEFNSKRNHYTLKEGTHEIEIELAELVELTRIHSLSVEINNGKIILQ